MYIPMLLMDAAQRRALKALYREYSNAGSGVMAPSLGVEVSPVNVHDEGEIERAVTTFGRSENNGLIVTASALVRVHCALMVALATRHKLPAVYWEFTDMESVDALTGAMQASSVNPLGVASARRLPNLLDRIADQPDRRIFSGRRRDEFELTKMR